MVLKFFKNRAAKHNSTAKNIDTNTKVDDPFDNDIEHVATKVAIDATKVDLDAIKVDVDAIKVDVDATKPNNDALEANISLNNEHITSKPTVIFLEHNINTYTIDNTDIISQTSMNVNNDSDNTKHPKIISATYRNIDINADVSTADNVKTTPNSTVSTTIGSINPKKIVKVISNSDNNSINKQTTSSSIPNGTNNLSKSKGLEYADKVDKIFDSLRQLFLPFKEIVVKVAPFLKPLVWVVEKVFFVIAYGVRFVLLRLRFMIRILKSKTTMVVLILLLLLFFSGAVLTRLVNNASYKQNIEDQIQAHFGYKAGISGNLVVRIFPALRLSINNLSLLKTNSQNNSIVDINSLSVERAVITFKFLPLLWGNLEIKNIFVSAPLATAVNSNNTNNIGEYNEAIIDIEKAISSILISPKTLEQINNSESITDSVTALNLGNSISNDVNLNLNSSNNINIEDNNAVINSIYSNDNASRAKSSGILGFLFRRLNLRSTIGVINIVKGKITILDNNNNRIFVLENINLKHKQNFFTSLGVYEGNMLYEGLLYYYNLGLSKNKYNLKLNSAGSFIDKEDYIEISGENNQGELSGNIDAKGKSVLSILSKFIIDTTYFSKASSGNYFKSDYNISNKGISFLNIDFRYLNNIYKADFNWVLSNLGSKVILNIHSDNFVVNKEDIIITAISNTNISDFIINNLAMWNNKLFDKFKSTVVDLNIKLINPSISGEKFKAINLNSFIYQKNFYLQNLTIEQEFETAKILGKIDLASKEGLLVIDMAGTNNQHSMIPYGDKIYNALVVVNEAEYKLSSKIVLQNSRIIFNNISGNINDFAFNDIVMIFLDRTRYYEFIINGTLKDVNADNLVYYAKHYLQFIDNNRKISGNRMAGKDLLKINLDINNFKYKALTFKNATINLEANSDGINIKQFLANGNHGGSISGSLNVNLQYLPVLVGSMQFNNLLIKLDDFTNLVVPKVKIVGNSLVNGKLRFSGTDYNEISSIDGDITFIKEERLKVNAINNANANGIYLTLSRNTKNKNSTILVNDLFGSLKITQNVMNFYPVFLLYIEDNKEYRGTFKGSLNVNNLHLNTVGVLDRTTNINNKINFELNGKLGTIDAKIKSVTLKQNNKAIVINQTEDILKRNIKSHASSNTLNDTSSKDHFNNTYSSGQDKETQKEIDAIFNDLLELNE